MADETQVEGEVAVEATSAPEPREGRGRGRGRGNDRGGNNGGGNDSNNYSNNNGSDNYNNNNGGNGGVAPVKSWSMGDASNPIVDSVSGNSLYGYGGITFNGYSNPYTTNQNAIGFNGSGGFLAGSAPALTTNGYDIAFNMDVYNGNSSSGFTVNQNQTILNP